MVFDFKVLERLPPDQRVNALQRLREELRSIIEKRKKEIEQSGREIAEAETLLQRAEDDLAVLVKVATPQQKAVRIDDLFYKDEKQKKEAGPFRTLDEDVGDAVVNRMRSAPDRKDLNYLIKPSAFDEVRRGYDDDKGERENPYKNQTGADDMRSGYSHNAPFNDEREKDEKKYKN